MTFRILLASFLMPVMFTVYSAAEPVAIVEDVSSPNVGVEFMDYLESGQTIHLGKGGRLTLGYFRSCLSETIQGGKVTVGAEQSRVEGGQVTRKRVECDGGQMSLTGSYPGKSGTIISRLPSGKGKKPPLPQLTIYGISPVIILPGGGEVILERLDRSEKAYRVVISNTHVDFLSLNKELMPGGLYKVRAGKKLIVFSVDALAYPGKVSLISRLIPFMP